MSIALPTGFLDDISSSSGSLELAVQPPGIVSKLFRYQLHALNFMQGREAKEQNGGFQGGILADEQGLGKTVMCAALVAHHRSPQLSLYDACCDSLDKRSCGATLIACTSAISQQWPNELKQHAPSLRVVTYTGQSDASEAAVQSECARLAAADVVIVTYDVLTAELASMEKSMESDKERRARLGMRVRNTDSESRPSPLKYLAFWRVILDEVQKAPASYKAGRTVRLVAATNRWAVSGTPMGNGQLADVAQLINFVVGERSSEEAVWRRASEAFSAGDPTAIAHLQAVLRPFFLRRTKAGVAAELSIPPQSVRRFTFDLSPQEKALQAEFVLPAAIAHYERGTTAAAAAQQIAAASSSSSAASSASGYGLDKQQQLVAHAQRALLSPAMWSKWGQTSKRAVEAQGDGSQGNNGGGGRGARGARSSRQAASAGASAQNKGLAMELVGDLVDDDRAKLLDPRRRGHAWPLHSGHSEALWPSLLTAARSEADRCLEVVRETVEKHALGNGEVQVNDLHTIQWLVSLKAIGQLGYVGPPIVATGQAPDVHQAAEIARRRQLTESALDVVIRVYTLRQQGAGGTDGVDERSAFGETSRWATSPDNSQGVRLVLETFLGLFPSNDDGAFPGRAHGQQLRSIEGMRWADVSPLLSLRMEQVEMSTEQMERFRSNISEMWRITDEGVTALAFPSLHRATQYLYALGSDLGDLFHEREEARLVVERRLMPDALMRRLQVGHQIARVESRMLYHLLGEHVPTSYQGETAQADRSWLRLLIGGYVYANSSLPVSLRMPQVDRNTLCEQARQAQHTKRAQLQKTRAFREQEAEAMRLAQITHVSELRARYERIRCMSTAAGAFCESEQRWVALQSGSSKIQALKRLISLLPAGDKVVAFTKFAEALPVVGEQLEASGIGAIALKEGAKRWWHPSFRAAASAVGSSAVEVFRSSARCRVMLLEANASAAGLTLTCAQHVVFLDVLNSDLLEEQAKARVARIGQSAKTTAWHLIANDSVDVLLRNAADKGKALAAGEEAPEAIGRILRCAAEKASEAARGRSGSARGFVSHAQWAPPEPFRSHAKTFGQTLGSP